MFLFLKNLIQSPFNVGTPLKYDLLLIGLKMSSREQWCADQISNLQEDELRFDALNDLKEHLSNLPRDEVNNTLEFLKLTTVFDCLNNSNP